MTKDDGYIIAAYTLDINVGSTNIYILKTDSDGETLWTKTYNFSSTDIAYSITPTNKNTYMITGSGTTGKFNNEDLFIMELDSLGELLWKKTYGSENREEYGLRIIQTPDNGYFIVGRKGIRSLTQSKDVDPWIIRTNEQGDTLWTWSMGGDAEDELLEVSQLNNNQYILVGATTSYGLGKGDVWLVKLQENNIQQIRKSSHYISRSLIDINIIAGVEPCVQFTLNMTENIRVSLFNINGAHINDIAIGRFKPGTYSFKTEMDMASGIYLFRIQLGNQITTKIITIIN